MGGFEQLDEVSSRVTEQDLTPARAGHDVAAKGNPGGAEPVNLGVEAVVEYQVNAIPAGV
jgi:hypothetical protein